MRTIGEEIGWLLPRMRYNSIFYYWFGRYEPIEDEL